MIEYNQGFIHDNRLFYREAIQVDFDIIVIGAGASGLIAAISAARQGSTVLVIEQKEKAGKKILATGNGKCNYTNLYQAPDCYRSNDSAFAMKVLSCFDVHQTIEFFKELGIYPKERDGYLYPNSEQALSVVQVLLLECDRLGVTFAYNERVIMINKPDFTVITERNTEIESKSGNKKNINKKSNTEMNKATNNETNKAVNKVATGTQAQKMTYYGKKLILSAGGCASPKLGSDGSGYTLAKSFGHSMIKPLPALVQLQSPEKYCKTLSGVRTGARIEVHGQRELLAKEEGEILFTDYGISGIPILQISRFAAKALEQGDKVQLSIDFLPEVSKEELESLLQKRILNNSNKNLEQMLVGLFHHKLSYTLILQAGLDPYKVTRLLKPQDLEALVMQVKGFTMKITDTNSFENAQVCAGGISTAEVDETSMESKQNKNLYLTGEILDVDGTCGGYNLQWAWSSGYLAGFSAGKR